MTDATTAPADESLSRVIRALVDYRCLWTTHDLVELSQVATPDVRRIIEDLRSKSLVSRGRGGIIAVPNWAPLLAHWSAGQSFPETSRSRWKVSDSFDDLFDRIAATSLKYALTGIHAVSAWTAVEPAGDVVLHTSDAQAAATAWALVPAETGDVVLAESETDVVYLRRRSTPSGLRLAAPAQVLADLLRQTAQTSRTAADSLLSWMQTDERLWRY